MEQARRSPFVTSFHQALGTCYILSRWMNVCLSFVSHISRICLRSCPYLILLHVHVRLSFCFLL